MLTKLISFLLFYSNILKLVNVFINNFRINQTTEGDINYPYITKRKSRNVQILVYHKVNDDYDLFFPATPVHIFRHQMEYLASNFNVYSLDDIVEMMKNDDVPDNAISITFDDGYKDIYLNAYPILRELSIPATIFIATDSISSRKLLWHDRVFSSFRKTTKSSLEWIGKYYPLSTLEEKLKTQIEILQFLRSMNDDDRILFVNDLVEKLSVCMLDDADNLMLSWKDVKIMHKNGLSVGSHSVTHPILSHASIDKKIMEIHNSKVAIEERLGTPIKSFAYPSGRKEDFDEVAKSLVKEAGYTCAVTMIFGVNECDQDLFELRRGTPWEDDIFTFGLKLSYYKFIS